MTNFGRYELFEKLGAGSMGTVYKARDTVLEREVAVKTIRTGVDVEPEIRERFYREARACARLQHPAIISVYDLGEIDQLAFIAMELLNGSDFRKLIERRAEIHLQAKLRAIINVCEALAHAHKHGIIHRDIKPSNLFFTEDERAKVLDFGIARLPSSRLTVAGKILGTPNYMAPEQILAKPSDQRADLFSAAVVFFEFLVYHHPFDAQLIPQRIAEGEPDSPLDFDSSLPVPIERVFSRALAKGPGSRYQSGEELASDIQSILDALRRESTPAFSYLELPSDRPFDPPRRHIAADADMSLFRPPPPGEDPEEWQFSEVLRLIPAFEGEINREDIHGAKGILAELEAIEAVDDRFSEAVQLCRLRFQELESRKNLTPELPSRENEWPSGSSALPETPSIREQARSDNKDRGTNAKICPYCAASNRAAAEYCVQCGAPISHDSRPDQPVRQIDIDGAALTTGSPEAKSADAGTLTNPGTEKPRAVQDDREINWKQEAVKPRPPALGIRSRVSSSRGAIVSAICVTAVLIAAVALQLRREPLQSPEATASVGANGSVLYSSASANHMKALVPPGEVVNVLRLPNSRSQALVPVQLSTGVKVGQQGYVQMKDLGQWHASNANSELSLIFIFGVGASGHVQDIDSEINSLSAWIDRHPNDPGVSKAQLELLRLSLAAIHELKMQGEPASAWESRLQTAQIVLRALKDPKIQNEVHEYQHQIDSLSSTVDSSSTNSKPPDTEPQSVPAPRTSTTLSPGQITWRMKQAERLRQEQKYDEAERYIAQVLRSQPHNTNAQLLQAKIREAKQFLADHEK
ncbi:MAG: protein kinase domain-containing protein [Bryobacteraceae bacterium]